MDLAVNVWGLPKKIVFQNYIDAWQVGKMGHYILNSVKVALVSIATTLICSSMLAFILARLRFKGRSIIYYGILLGLMIPIHAIIIPLYITTRDLGLHNNLYCIGLVYAAFQIPFSVFCPERIYGRHPGFSRGSSHPGWLRGDQGVSLHHSSTDERRIDYNCDSYTNVRME